MIRRRTMERLAAFGLVLTAVGLGAGVYLALGPAPVRDRTDGPTAVTPASDGPLGPLSEADLKPLWEGLDPKRSGSALPSPLSAAPASSFAVQGIVFSPNGDSVAFIGVNSKVQLYGVGDVINDWRITAIEPGRVLFDKEGEELALGLSGRKYEALSSRDLPLLAGAPVVAPEFSTAPGLGARRNGPMRSFPVATQKGSARFPTAEERAAVDATVALPANVAELARNDPASVMEGVTLEPFAAGGTMRGINIAQLAANSLAARYGLAPGDRILAVNGEPLDSSSRVYQLYNRYRHSDSVRVTIERAGQVKNVLYYAQ
jgi:type II secretion system protein C